ncbi:hypothetical protein SIRV1gp05 [Sulfolobus islandicus rod-shaped virus 1]|uniref:Uncharacterized protein 105 n=1 Tax=Sulfolobus islandicus rod-shaped virus 1 TaxID=157898 RepID=Y105_SIRV1|nr:hypothetical protein SIRV1gp05 [Sulfolobus islandicus rod-shaped virus 1]Q8QL49.1 RecName: Full=Uncharacterized protein 105 [Sulfolobus islandicus rod-shaped virus 1]CAC93960.1 hypothetical protein [Sulfolobus islandicus rod-shaped virus 1]CAG38825.1 hypothetical protein [Sulfolobus islandicus rudivirus 1 variant XX]
MNYMIFNSLIVQKYILNNAKAVATIRKKGYYKLYQKIILKVGDKRFYGKVIAKAPVTEYCLSKYVKFSGFENVENWLNEAKRLHNDKIDFERYEIIVIWINDSFF